MEAAPKMKMNSPLWSSRPSMASRRAWPIMPPMDSRKVMTMPPMRMADRRSTALELHQTQAVSRMVKIRLVRTRGGVMPQLDCRACWTTEPPLLT